MDLSGAVAIVTGGSGGLGQRICKALAEAGTDVAVVYATSRDEAQAVASRLRDTGVHADAIECDVADPHQVSAMVSRVLEMFGRVDVLVNDAALNKWIPFRDLDAVTYDDWQTIIAVNLTGPMLCAKAVAPIMRRQGAGRIINIASTAGIVPAGSSIPYAVSKAGLIHLTRCLAVGLAPEILVNCIAPGYLEGTKATANLEPLYREQAKAGSLLKMAADKDEVAGQVVTFCRANTITGQNLVIDAGRIFHMQR